MHKFFINQFEARQILHGLLLFLGLNPSSLANMFTQCHHLDHHFSWDTRGVCSYPPAADFKSNLVDVLNDILPGMILVFFVHSVSNGWFSTLRLPSSSDIVCLHIPCVSNSCGIVCLHIPC